MYTCYRVNSESDILSFLSQELYHFSNRVLSLGNTETVSGHYNNVLGISNVLCTDGNITFCGSTSNLHGFTSSMRLCSDVSTSQDDVGQRSVHGLSVKNNNLYYIITFIHKAQVNNKIFAKAICSMFNYILEIFI